jgi:hypothetical protein
MVQYYRVRVKSKNGHFKSGLISPGLNEVFTLDRQRKKVETSECKNLPEFVPLEASRQNPVATCHA